MPIDPRIYSDLSIADITNVIGPDPTLTISNRGDSVVQSIEQYTQEQNQLTYLQFPSDRPKYFFLIALAHYSRKNLLEMTPNLNTVENIILPVPNSIMDAHEVSYTEYQFGTFAGSLANQAIEKAGGTEGFKNTAAGTKGLKELGGQLASGATTGIVPGLAGTALELGPVGGAAQAALGVSPNQFFTILLKGPVYKRLSFTWNLVPRTPQESRIIRDIIMVLNNASAPGIAFGGAIFTFPMVARCAFMPNHSYLYRMKPAVIENLTFDYSPGAVPSFFHTTETTEDNPPEAIRLTMNILELEYWLRSDFKADSDNPFDTTGTQRTDPESLGGQAEQILRDIIEQSRNASATPPTTGGGE